jgi:hypothetical protein
VVQIPQNLRHPIQEREVSLTPNTDCAFLFSCNSLIGTHAESAPKLRNIGYFSYLSMFDDIDKIKADLLETELLVEQMEQREQMLKTKKQNSTGSDNYIYIKLPKDTAFILPNSFKLPECIMRTTYTKRL